MDGEGNRRRQKQQESVGREEKYPRTNALLTRASPRPKARMEPGSPEALHPSAAGAGDRWPLLPLSPRSLWTAAISDGQ